MYSSLSLSLSLCVCVAIVHSSACLSAPNSIFCPFYAIPHSASATEVLSELLTTTS
eukprot:m.51953 g.51953  ORF g.51953 m.51953 type:complete len:56 (+) comp7345_c0_seq2:144-311(+)